MLTLKGFESLRSHVKKELRTTFIFLGAAWLELFAMFLLWGNVLGFRRNPVAESAVLATNVFAWILIAIVAVVGAINVHRWWKRRERPPV